MKFKLQTLQLLSPFQDPRRGPYQYVHISLGFTKNYRNKIFKPQLVKPAASLHFNFPFIILVSGQVSLE